MTAGGVIIESEVSEGWGRERGERMVGMVREGERRMEGVLGFRGVAGREWVWYQRRTVRDVRWVEG